MTRNNQPDISTREPVSTQIFTAIRQNPVEPHRPLPPDPLQIIRSLRDHLQPWLKHLQPLPEPKPVENRHLQIKINTTKPHPRLGFFFSGRAKQGAVVFVVEVFRNDGDFGEDLAVVEEQGGALPGGIDFGDVRG